MELLKLVEITLSNHRDVISKVLRLSHSEIYEKVQLFITENTLQWRKERPAINYADPICRLAYIYMNVPIHSYLIEHCLKAVANEIEATFQEANDEDVNICAIGGGPGSELIGLTSYLIKQDHARQYHLDFLLIDFVKEWDESWHSLKKSIDDYQRSLFHERVKWRIAVNRSFIPINALERKDFEGFSIRLAGIKLYFFSYVFSELRHNIPAFTNTLSFIVELSLPGTLFFFLDRDQAAVKRKLKQITNDLDLQIKGEIPRLSGSVDLDLRALRDWHLNIERLPRRSYKSFFILAQKGR